MAKVTAQQAIAAILHVSFLRHAKVALGLCPSLRHERRRQVPRLIVGHHPRGAIVPYDQSGHTTMIGCEAQPSRHGNAQGSANEVSNNVAVAYQELGAVLVGLCTEQCVGLFEASAVLGDRVGRVPPRARGETLAKQIAHLKVAAHMPAHDVCSLARANHAAHMKALNPFARQTAAYMIGLGAPDIRKAQIAALLHVVLPMTNHNKNPTFHALHGTGFEPTQATNSPRRILAVSTARRRAVTAQIFRALGRVPKFLRVGGLGGISSSSALLLGDVLQHAALVAP